MRLLLFLSLLFLCYSRAEKHTISCETTAGDLEIVLDDALSPLGVARVLDLVDADFFNEMGQQKKHPLTATPLLVCSTFPLRSSAKILCQLLYRVLPRFLIQFGVPASPNVMREWQWKYFADEPKLAAFEEGTISFAGYGADSRTCHLFIALAPDGLTLGNALHETPLGKVTKGLDTLQNIVNRHQAAYNGVDTGVLQLDLVARGNAAAAAYPQLDRFKKCAVVVPSAAPPSLSVPGPPQTCSQLGWTSAIANGVCGASFTNMEAPGVDKCFNKRSQDEARRICERIGARLCSVSEIEAGAGISSGCQHDQQVLWSATPCGDNKYVAIQGNGKGARSCAAAMSRLPVRCCSQPDRSSGDGVSSSSPPPQSFSRLDVQAKSCSDLGWTVNVVNNVCGHSSIGLDPKGSSTKCWTNRKHKSASKICARAGARLCSSEEYTSGALQGSGCSLDSKHVWTSTSCGEGAFLAIKLNKGGDTQCVDATVNHPVRCCADA